MSDLSAEVAELLEVLGSKLQGPAEEAFGIYVRQYMLDGVMTTALGLVFCVAGVMLFRYGCGRTRKRFDAGHTTSSDTLEDSAIIATIGVILAAVAAVVISRGIICTANPEFYALQALLEHLPG